MAPSKPELQRPWRGTPTPWQGYPAADTKGDAAAQAFADQGFFLWPHSLFERGALAAAVRGMDMVIAGASDTGGVVGSPERLHTFSAGELIKLENPQLASDAIMSLISLGSGAKRLGELVARLTGADWVQIWHVQLLAKPSLDAAVPLEAGASSVGYHQDRHYHQDDWTDGSEILTAWIALSDVESKQDGPMQFVDGSHKWGKLVSAAGNNFFGQDLSAQKAALQGKSSRRPPCTRHPCVRSTVFLLIASCS